MLIKFLFFNIFFMTFSAGLFIKMGAPFAINLLVEISIASLLFISIISRSGKKIYLQNVLIVFLIYIFLTPLSVLYNDTLFFRAADPIRFLFRFYFFYLAITWLEPNDEYLKKLNILILFLMVLQFPVIAVRFIENGIGENTMGAWVRSGSVTAALWFSGIFYCAGFYFIYKRSKNLILLAVAFVIASIVGAKRIVFFLYPFQFISIYYYIYSKVFKLIFSTKILIVMIIILLSTFVSGTVLYFNKSYNPDKEVGNIDLVYALEYAKEYNEGVTASGYTFGRYSTTKRVFKLLYDLGFGHFLVGAGPGVTTKSSFDDKKTRMLFEQRYDEFKIHYGLTPLNRIMLEFGLIGLIPYTWMLFVFSVRSWKLYNQETDPYWKSFAAGSVGFSITMIFFYFCYSHSIFWGYTMPLFYFYAMAVVSIRYKKHFRQKEEKSFNKQVLNERVPTTA